MSGIVGHRGLLLRVAGGIGGNGTWNSLDKAPGIVLSNSDTVATGTGTAGLVRGTRGRSDTSGTYQFELVLLAPGSTDSVYLGIARGTDPTSGFPGATNTSVGYRRNSAIWWNSNVATATTSFTTGDVIGFAYTFTTESRLLRIFKNGVAQGGETFNNSIIGTATPVFPAVGGGGSSNGWSVALRTSGFAFPVAGALPWD